MSPQNYDILYCENLWPFILYSKSLNVSKEELEAAIHPYASPHVGIPRVAFTWFSLKICIKCINVLILEILYQKLEKLSKILPENIEYKVENNNEKKTMFPEKYLLGVTFLTSCFSHFFTKYFLFLYTKSKCGKFLQWSFIFE